MTSISGDYRIKTPRNFLLTSSNFNAISNAATFAGTFTAGTLAVTNNAQVGGNLGVSGAAAVTGTFTVTGNATLAANVTVAGTLIAETLSVNSNAQVGGNLGVTGAATFSGGLSARLGAGELFQVNSEDGALTHVSINSAGAAVFGGVVDFDNDVNVNGVLNHTGDLNHTGNANFTVTTSDNFNIYFDDGVNATNVAVHVNDAGSVEIGQTLAVTGAATVGGAFTVAGDATFAASATVVGTLTANTLSVTGGATVGGAFTVTGDATFAASATVAGTLTANTLSVTGGATVGGAFTVDGDATFANSATVAGTLIANTLSVTDAATVGGAFTVTGDATFATNVTVVGTLTANTLSVTGAATVGGAFTVTGDATFAASATVAGTLIANTLSVTGAATVGGAFEVTGDATFATNVTANTLSVTDAATVGGAFEVTGNATFATNVTANTLSVTDAAAVGGTFIVTGAATFNGGVVADLGTGESFKINNQTGATIVAIGGLGTATFYGPVLISYTDNDSPDDIFQIKRGNDQYFVVSTDTLQIGKQNGVGPSIYGNTARIYAPLEVLGGLVVKNGAIGTTTLFEINTSNGNVTMEGVLQINGGLSATLNSTETFVINQTSGTAVFQVNTTGRVTLGAAGLTVNVVDDLEVGGELTVGTLYANIVENRHTNLLDAKFVALGGTQGITSDGVNNRFHYLQVATTTVATVARALIPADSITCNAGIIKGNLFVAHSSDANGFASNQGKLGIYEIEFPFFQESGEGVQIMDVTEDSGAAGTAVNFRVVRDLSNFDPNTQISFTNAEVGGADSAILGVATTQATAVYAYFEFRAIGLRT